MNWVCTVPLPRVVQVESGLRSSKKYGHAGGGEEIERERKGKNRKRKTILVGLHKQFYDNSLNISKRTIMKI